MQRMRIAAVALVFSVIAAPVYAQGLRLGVKGGVASSTVYGDGVEDDEAGSLTRLWAVRSWSSASRRCSQSSLSCSCR